MFKFKKDKLLLLKALRDIVSQSMDVNPMIEEDASEFLAELTNKKNIRRMKNMRGELDKWIDEMAHDQKLQKEERLFNEVKRKQYENHIANRDQ